MKFKSRFFAILFSLILVFSTFQPAFAADNNEQTGDSPYEFYVPIGTSITGGFGMPSYSSKSNAPNNYSFTPGTFSRLVAEHYNLSQDQRYDGALLGTRAYEFRVIFEDDLHGDDFTEGWSFEKSKNGEEKLKKISSTYKENIAKADLITIELGSNEMISTVIFEVQRFVEKKEAESETTDDDNTFLAWLKDVANETQSQQLIALLAIADKYGYYPEAIKIAGETLVKSMNQFCKTDFDKLLDDIYALNTKNPDIYVLSVYNPVRNLLENDVTNNTTGAKEVRKIILSTGEELGLTDEQITNISETLVTPVIDAMNLFLRNGSKYSSKYTYVDTTNVNLTGSVDGIHPAAVGHENIADYIISAIDKNLVAREKAECKHTHKSSTRAILPTFLTLGFTGIEYCADCGKVLSIGKVITYSQYKNQQSSADVTQENKYPTVDYQVLAFTSDVHNMQGNVAAERLKNWIESTQENEGKFDFIGLCGDNARGDDTKFGDAYWALVDPVFSVLDQSAVPYAVTTGNHEVKNGYYPDNTTNATAKKVSRLEEVAPSGANYHIYTFGAKIGREEGEEHYEIAEDDITALKNYLNKVGKSKPVFIMSHYPLHDSGGSDREVFNNEKVIDLLNAYPNVIFLWGHNHTNADDEEEHYDQVFTGDIDGQPINFTYCAAGCMSDSEYVNGGSAYVDGKGLVATVTKGNDPTVTLTYLDESGKAIADTVTVNLKAQESKAPGAVSAGYSYTKVSADKLKNGYTYLIVDTTTNTALNTSFCRGYVNKNRSGYSGLKGSKVTLDSDNVTGGVTEDMLWKFEGNSSSGFTIKNRFTGKYLNALDYSCFGPTGGGALYCDDTEDTWKITKISKKTDGKMKSTQSGKYLSFETDETVSSYKPLEDGSEVDLFSVRSDGTNVAFYQVEASESLPVELVEGTYSYSKVEPANLKDGGTYLIVCKKNGDDSIGINGIINMALDTTYCAGYENTNHSNYSGLEGKTVTFAGDNITSGVTKDMLWEFSSTGKNGVYMIKNSLTNKYLNADSNGGGALFLGSSGEQWTVGSNGELKHNKSTKYLVFESLGTVSDARDVNKHPEDLYDFFTIRTNGNTFEFYEVEAPKDYTKVYAPAAGGNYIIYAGGSAMDTNYIGKLGGYCDTNSGTNKHGYSGLKGISTLYKNNVIDKSIVARDIVWNFETASGGFYIKNVLTGEYLNSSYDGANGAPIGGEITLGTEKELWEFESGKLKSSKTSKYLVFDSTKSSKISEGESGFFTVHSDGEALSFISITNVSEIPTIYPERALGECPQFKLSSIGKGTYNVVVNGNAIGVKNGVLVSADASTTDYRSGEDLDCYLWEIKSSGVDGKWSIKNVDSSKYLSIYVSTKLLSYTASASLTSQPFAWNFDTGFNADVSVKALFGLKGTATYYLTCSGDNVTVSKKSVTNNTLLYKKYAGTHDIKKEGNVYTCNNCHKTVTVSNPA